MRAEVPAIPDSDCELLDRVEQLLPGFSAKAAERDERAELPAQELQELHEVGVTHASLPKKLGGGGLSYRGFGELICRIAAVDPSIATILTMHTGAGVGLSEITRGTLGDFFINEYLKGKRFSNALSEPTSGNRFLNPQQEALPAEGGWHLDGAKRFVSGSEIADYLLVNALVDGTPTFFAVIPDETVSVIPIWDTLGLRATRSQLLAFDGTLLRPEHRGRPVQPGDFAAIPAGLPAISLGVADAALGALIDHAQNRQVLGRPLSYQQWVQHEVTEVQVRLQAAHALFCEALGQADLHDPGFFPNLSRAKYLANKVAVEVAQLGMRIGGGTGYLKKSPIQRHLRDAQAGQLMAYSTEVLAGEIGKQVLGVDEEEH